LIVIEGTAVEVADPSLAICTVALDPLS